MKTISKEFVAETEDAIDAQIDGYNLCYPWMGYNTRLKIKEQREDGFWYARMERQSSCD